MMCWCELSRRKNRVLLDTAETEEASAGPGRMGSYTEEEPEAVKSDRLSSSS